MSTATFPQGGAGRSATYGGDAGLARASMLSWRAVEVLAVLAGIVGFGVAIVALRFALAAQHFVTPHVALGIAIGTAIAGTGAFYGASRLEARRTQFVR